MKALEAEIDLLKNLRHDRIVLYYGTQQTDLHVYIFMEYMPGVRIARSMSVSEKLRIYSFPNPTRVNG